MTGVEVRVLGPVSATVNDRPVDLGGSRQRRLLAALTLDRGRAVSAEELAHRVWSDGAMPADPRRALRTYLSRLRTALDADGAIVSETGGWRLDRAVVDTDAARFEAEILADRELELDVHERLAALDQSLAHWTGDAYEGIDDAWVMPERERLEELRLVATERRFEAMLEAGLHHDVVPALRRELDRFPLRERLLRCLMLALHRSGRSAEASQAFENHRRELAEGVGLSPSQETIELDRRIVTDDPSLVHEVAGGRPLRGYRVGSQIGEGAFATVYRGIQPSVGREVAIKVVRAELANDPDFIRRFEAEAHLVAQLEHPFIVPLYDYWREPGRAFLVLRYLRGGTLEARLTGSGGLGVAEAALLAAQVGSALATAHRAGVIHRDVKPANIFCDDEGNHYLGDFGIAARGAADDDVGSGRSVGSPAYASPEQLRRQPVGPAADVHGLGVSLFEALTARLPFADATSHAELLQLRLSGEIPSVRQYRSDLPSGVDEVLRRATAPDPTDRYGDVQALVDDFVGALEGGQAVARPRDSVTVISEAANPYRGLRSFTEADAAHFHGRERLVTRICGMLERPGTAGRIVALVGPSGIGKSSVVRAGLVPALRRGAVPGSDHWYVATMLPGRDPFDELASALLRVATEIPGDLYRLLTEDHRGVARVVKAVVPADSDTELLLVIDQFEELFTMVDAEADRQRFLDALGHALTDARCPLRVVLTVRADHWDRPLRHGAFASLLDSSVVNVTALAPDELERAITVPARSMGVEFEPGLVSEIVADLHDQPGALPLLQYALTGLWEERVSDLMTLDAYRGLGGVAGALAGRAEELYGELDDAERAAARRLFPRLISLGEGREDTRARVTRVSLGDDPAIGTVLDSYGTARLLAFDRDDDSREPTVEIAHEALIREWPRLREWIEADRDDLRRRRHLEAAAFAWEASGRDTGELYRGARLDDAVELLDDGELTGVEREFVETSRDAAQEEVTRERRRNRRLRRAVAVAVAFAVFAGAAGLVAVVQQRSANDTRFVAESERMASDAVGFFDSDPSVALVMAVEAYRRSPNARTLGGLQQVLSSSGSFLGLRAVGLDAVGVRWLDQRTVVVLGPDRLVFVDAETGAESEPVAMSDVRLDINGGARMVTSAAGDAAAILHTDATVSIVGRDGRVLTVPFPAPVTAVQFAPEGGVLYVGDASGVLHEVEVVTGSVLRSVLAHPPRAPDDPPPDGFQIRLGDRLQGPGVQAIAVGDDVVLTAGQLTLAGWDRAALDRIWVTEDGPLPLEGDGLATPGLRVLPSVQSATVGTDDPSVARLSAGWLIGEVELGTGRQQWIWDAELLLRDTPPSVLAVSEGVHGHALIDSDGFVRRRDRDGAPVGAGLAVPFGRGRSLEVAPDGETIAIGTNVGLVLAALDGRGLISTSVALDGAGRADLLPGGDRLIMSGPGWSRLHEFGPDGWIEVVSPAVAERGVLWEPEFGERTLREARPNADAGNADIRLVDPDSFEPVSRWIIEGANSLRLPERDAVLVYRLSQLGAPDPDAPPALRVERLSSEELVVPPIPVPEGDPVFIPLATMEDGRVLGRTLGLRIEAFDPDEMAFVDSPILEPEIHTVAVDSRTGHVWVMYVDGSIEERSVDGTSVLRRIVSGEAPTNTDLVEQLWFDTEDGVILSPAGPAPRLIDLDSGLVIGGTFPHQPVLGPITGLDADADSPLRLVTLLDGNAVIWDLDSDGWVDIACAAAGRNLTQEEWERLGPRSSDYSQTCSQWPAGT